MTDGEHHGSVILHSIRQYRDRYAGGLVALVGCATIAQSVRYDIGALAAIGPGFFPLVMGVILVLSGIVIAMNAGEDEGNEHDRIELDRADWRGWLCIIGGVASFILLAKSAGLFPATFACVFISALGDRSTKLRSVALLATSIAIFGTLLFHYGLKVQLPPFAW